MNDVLPPHRIALIHALEESILPTRKAFEKHWPRARIFDLLDTSLAEDPAYRRGELDEAIYKRLEILADYASTTEGDGGRAQGILFTCSAFGPAIDAVKRLLSIPVLRPNEAAFEEAIAKGDSIGLVVTFEPSLHSLSRELEMMAADTGRLIKVHGIFAEGALAALKSGDFELHDKLAAEAARQLPIVDIVVLGQFSLARARHAVESVVAVPVITTPDSAVGALRQRIMVGPDC